MRYVLVLMLAAVLSGLGLYAFQNTATSEVHFGWWTWIGVPDWYPVAGAGASVLVTFVAYVLLAGAGWRVRHLLLYRSKMQRDANLEEVQRANERLREEVAALRAEGSDAGGRNGWTPLSGRRANLFRR
jgi:hypothetical protein